MTVTRFENGKSGGYPETLQKVQSAFEKAGVIFVDENGNGPGVMLHKQKISASPMPKGPATDVVEKMDAAIAEHRSKQKK